MNAPADSDPRNRALKEAVERQAATAEILEIIASSPTDTQPVFDAIVRGGLRLFADAAISIALPDGDKIRAAAVAEHDAARAEAWRNRFPFPLRRDYMHGVAILDAKTLDIADVANAPPEVAVGAQNFLASGYRAITIMPMMRGDAAIGALSVVRRAVGPLSDEQLAVLKTFAAQAVIAIENTRLVNELRQRTDDLTEALEQQTATAEVLRVISSSPGALEPVFQSVLENAVKLCEAKFGVVYRYEDNACYPAGMVNAPPAYADFVKARGRFTPQEGNALDRALKTRRLVYSADEADSPVPTPSAKLAGARSQILVPMLKEQELVGAIAIFRQEVRPFTDKQIELVTNFAAQAVIAIENTRLLNELRQRTDDLSESLEQQTATSEVLQVISSSPGTLEPVFNVMLAKATQLCEASHGTLWLQDDDGFRAAARYGVLPAALEAKWWTGTRFQPRSDVPLARCAGTRKPVHVSDMRMEQGYLDGDPWMVSGVDAVGLRSLVVVPMLKEDKLVGAIAIYRTEVRPFTDKQVELVANFAAQAVIAIENTRLLTELRQRTGDLAVSLEQQTATSEILASISGSMTDSKPVFEAIVRNLLRLFGTGLAMVQVLKDGMLHLEAASSSAEFEILKQAFPQPMDENSGAGRCVIAKQVLQFAPVSDDPAAPPLSRRMARALGFETVVFAPMMRGESVFGAIATARPGTTPFTEKEVELITTFADQAVIAIENARLLTELRQRTDDLTESLEQQTATSEVLRVISSSPGELEPVFTTMLANALRICEAKFGILLRRVDDTFWVEALQNVPPAYAEFMRGGMQPGSDTGLGRVVLTRQTVHIPDITAEAAYLEGDPVRVATVELGGTRSFLAVPMLKDSELIGAIVIYRTEVRPFTDKQIELVTNFAAQAVIAIENTRLLTELRQRTDDLTESLEQQTATSEVLKVISNSPGDLNPVFNTMLENATRICEAKFGNLFLCEGDAYRAVAVHGGPGTVERWRRDPVIRGGPKNPLTRLAATKQIQHIADIRNDEAYAERDPTFVPLADMAGARALLIVPMLNENELVGAISMYREEVRPFSDKQIALVTNFAAQAVIAIENTRLLSELRQRTDDLSESLEQQTAISEILRVISVSPGDLQPVFDTVAERAAHICEAQNVRIFVVEEGKLRPTAAFGDLEQFERIRNDRMPLNRETVMGRSIVDRQSVHITDLQSTDHDFPLGRELALGLGHRTTMAIPLLHEDRALGTILMRRAEVRPFEDKHIALLKTFANQAAIAIENTRLLSEVRQQASQLAAQSQELRTLNQGLEQRVDEQVGEIERMSRLRRFLPPQVADLIVSSGAEKQLESHRREITALFCDLRGFTGFSETSDPEDVMALLREYHKAIGEIIFRHGGTLERFAGDGVMVIFNDPVPLPNPALSAVQMALEMRAAIGALIEKWSRLGHELGFGIGISHGYATLGTIGFEGRFDYAAIGTVSNVASRLCDEAAPGQILVSPRVLLAVEDAVAVEPVREMSLKGIRRPMLVHNVVGAATGSSGGD